jgi:hypothetical protein
MRWIWRSMTIMVPLAALCFAQDWLQWAQNPQHTGRVSILGQHPGRILADLVYDPWVTQEQAEVSGELLAHYQAPLVQDQDVFMEFKSGNYVNCSPPGIGGGP